MIFVGVVAVKYLFVLNIIQCKIFKLEWVNFMDADLKFAQKKLDQAKLSELDERLADYINEKKHRN